MFLRLLKTCKYLTNNTLILERNMGGDMLSYYESTNKYSNIIKCVLLLEAGC